MRKRNEIINGLSYHSGEIIATYKELQEILGKPTYWNAQPDGSNVVWDLYNSDNEPCEVYNVHLIENINEKQLFRIRSFTGIAGITLELEINEKLSEL